MKKSTGKTPRSICLIYDLWCSSANAQGEHLRDLRASFFPFVLPSLKALACFQFEGRALYTLRPHITHLTELSSYDLWMTSLESC